MNQVDPILEAIGGRGKYQLIQYFFTTAAAFSAAFQLLNFVFVGRIVPHTCKEPANISDVYNAIGNDIFQPNNSFVHFDKCKILVKANVSDTLYSSDLPCLYGYEYAEKKETSVISDMDIVCDRAPLRGLGQTLLILGQGIGALTLPIFSDRYGRRTVLLASHSCFLVLGVAIAFAPNFTVFLVLRIILGIVQQGIVLAVNTISVEIFSKRRRRFSVLLGSFVWNLSAALIPLVAYLMESYSWRYTQLAYCSVSLYVIVQFFVLDESLTWLITNRKVKRVERNLKKAARICGKDEKAVLAMYRRFLETQEEVLHIAQPVPEQEKKLLNSEGEPAKKTEKIKDPTKPSFLDLLKRKQMALSVCVLWFMWMTDSMTVFGLFMTAHSLVGNRYINFLALSVVDVPAVFIFYYMVDRFGRRRTSMTFHGIAGTSLLLATVIKYVGHGSRWSGIAVTVFSCVGMFGASTAWGVSFFYTPELFPTNLRNFGLGTASSFSRLGGMLAPFASLLAEYVSWAPGAIFSGCCILVSVLVNLLPESMGRELPQTLDDLEVWYKTSPRKRNKNDKDIKMEEAY